MLVLFKRGFVSQLQAPTVVDTVESRAGIGSSLKANQLFEAVNGRSLFVVQDRLVDTLPHFLLLLVISPLQRLFVGYL